jgi:hypothetical protein
LLPRKRSGSAAAFEIKKVNLSSLIQGGYAPEFRIRIARGELLVCLKGSDKCSVRKIDNLQYAVPAGE